MADEKESKAQALKIAIDQIEKQHGKTMATSLPG